MVNNRRPEWHDMQGLIISAFPQLDAAEYVPLQIDDPEMARQWFGRMADLVTTAFEHPQFAVHPFTGTFGPTVKLNVNVAITYSGLAKLWNLSKDDRDSFAYPFVEGIAGNPHRSRILGDVGKSEPNSWRWGGARNPVDVLLMVFAEDDSSRDHAVQVALTSSGLSPILNERLIALSLKAANQREHFGFVDGKSQPILTGTADAERFSESMHVTELGEFVLGYPNTDQQVIVPAGQQFDFLKNGSYLVLRQLAQDVPLFWRFVHENAGAANAEMLASKIVGRWPDGRPLLPGGHADNNEFDYAGDPHGFGCPVGSHIRRSNPRGSLSEEPFHREKVNGHRVLRRGRSYGPKWSGDPDDTRPRGLVFLVLNADIERQFEFISQNWTNGASFSGLSGETDPLVGARSGDARFTIPSVPARRAVKGLKDFVTVQGGEYFFLPGIQALKRLAGAK